jgi:RIO kinase 1
MIKDEEDALVEEFVELLEDNEPITKTNTNLERLAGRILNVHEDYRTRLSDPKFNKDKNKYTDRANRAVSEQVLDPRIRTILLKLIKNGLLYEINGCISTGKEANVYHAMTEAGEHRAIKIYKSTILTFKNRDRYVTGEYRFRTGYARSNPRKMTATWAEKEMRNLKRLEAAEIPCPQVFCLKAQVLLMSFIPEISTGDDSEWPAPRLKDFNGTDDDFLDLYKQCLRLMRTLFHECHLVHADLSEYNLLVSGRTLVMIDVSQSVEHEHPNALSFLRHDCKTILNFFQSRNISVPSPRGLFEFVTSPTADISDIAIGQLASTYPQDKENDAQFENLNLPRNINQVDFEKQPEGFELYKKMTLKREAIDKLDVLDSCNDNDTFEDEDSEESFDFEGDESPKESQDASATADELKAQRKQHKSLIKAQNRERRATRKIPKHVKKKATKRSNGK